MAAAEALNDAIDRAIEYFNARQMDLPDGLFDRKTQFVINGVSFEALLSAAANASLVMMLARGPAGFRFTAKALQHAMPDAKLERASIPPAPAPPDPILRGPSGSLVAMELRLSGTLRGTSDTVDAVVAVTLRLAQAGHVEIAEAAMDPPVLEAIRAARLRA